MTNIKVKILRHQDCATKFPGLRCWCCCLPFPELCWLDPACASASAAICSVQGREHGVLALCGLSGQHTGALIRHSTPQSPVFPGREAGREGGCWPWELLAHPPAASTLSLPGTWLGTSSLSSGASIILLRRITLDKCQQMTLSPVNEVSFLP